MKKPTDFAYLLTSVLSVYLPGQCGYSSCTISSYRDTFTLFLRFCEQKHKLHPDKITF